MTHALPWALDHVHAYAIEDLDGWTLVDTGLDRPSTRAGWERVLAELGSPRVDRLVITHYHPDHIGASGFLAELTDAREIVQGRRDRAVSVRAWGPEQDLDAFQGYLRRHGMPVDAVAQSASEELGSAVLLAEPTLLVEEGDALALAGETFRVLVLPGHADGHIALFGELSGRLFCGDVILDGITPNVGRWEDTDPDPLGRYLATLDRLAALGPTVAYPGHRGLLHDVPTRAAEIRAHHQERLTVCERALRDGAVTSWEVAERVWGNDLGLHERRFALVEAISHLERLACERRAEEVETGRWRAAGARP